MNNGVLPKATGGSHWLTYLPGYVYCFVPSYEADKGTAFAYDHFPDFLLDFQYCVEITELNFDLSDGNNSHQGGLGDGNKSKQEGMDVNKSNMGKIDGNKSNLGGMHGNKSNMGGMLGNKSNQGGLHGNDSIMGGIHGNKSNLGRMHGNKSNLGGMHDNKSNPGGRHGNKSNPGGRHGNKSNPGRRHGNKLIQLGGMQRSKFYQGGISGYKSRHGERDGNKSFQSNNSNQSRQDSSKSHHGVGRGASPGKQGGQEPRDVKNDVKEAAFGKRAVQPGHRDVYELKNVTKKNVTGINVGKNSKKKKIYFGRSSYI